MIVLGRLTAPHGVKGWLHLHPFGDDPASWGELTHWWIGQDDKDFSVWQCIEPDVVQLHGKGWVVKLATIDDRTSAERLSGYFFGVPREALPAPAQDEFYWADLIGMKVVTLQQTVLGRVAGLMESGAHAVLVVRQGEGKDVVERLLPFVGAIVKEVDIDRGLIQVDWQSDW